MRLLSLFLFLLPFYCVAQTDNLTEPKMDISVVCLLVNDYENAIEFYTEKLGFVISMNRKFGENQRWVSIRLPNSSLELSLGLANNKEDSVLVGKQSGKFPFFVLTTTHFEKTYHEYVLNGVEFVDEPKKNPWGKTAVLKDLYGNQILLKEK